MIVWLAAVLWLVIVAWSLALMRAADATEGKSEARAARRALRDAWSAHGSERRSLVAGIETVLLVGSIAGAVLLSSSRQWDSPELIALVAVLAWGSEFLTLKTSRARISGSFHGLVLAMALLGPAPAVAIGLGCAAIGARHTRARGVSLIGNTASHAFVPLLGGILLAEIRDTPFVHDGGFALSVFVVFCVANVLNFTIVASDIALTRGGSLRDMFGRVLLPVVPWELATGAMTAMAVYGFELYGIGVVGLFVLALGVCQPLLAALLRGREHSEELQRRMAQIDVRHEGMVGLLLETLALRDPSAARHAAAVAHYSHRLARAAGLSAHEQAVAHTAGLLHDIGKEGLPDHMLLGRSDLHAAERGPIERHPADGARLLLRVEGLGAVANAVLAHHERIDGHGYPDALSGEDIPITARIVAIAEVYDVLTAPDSYRVRMTPAEAEAELRRVAGSQLDGRLVWLFVTQVLRGTVVDDPGRTADLEAELHVQRHMSGMLDEPLMLGPPTA